MEASKLLQKARKIVDILLEVVNNSKDLNDLGFVMSASRIILADELAKSYIEDSEEDIDVEDKEYLKLQSGLASSLVELELIFLQATYKPQKIDFLKHMAKNWPRVRRNSNKLLKHKNIQWVEFIYDNSSTDVNEKEKEVRYIG
jgi:hypothetical protein